MTLVAWKGGLLHVLKSVHLPGDATHQHTLETWATIPCIHPSDPLHFDKIPSLKLTSYPLKMDGWKTILSFWVSAYFSVDMLVSRSVSVRKIASLWDVARGFLGSKASWKRSKGCWEDTQEHQMLYLPGTPIQTTSFKWMLPSGKLTWQWKSTFSNREYIFKWWIFHCYVSLLEGWLNNHTPRKDLEFLQFKQQFINGCFGLEV